MIGRRAWSTRITTLVVGMAVVWGLGGCTLLSSRKVLFSNASSGWVNVRYFVKGPDPASELTNEFLNRKTLQVGPGETSGYAPPSDGLLHLQVQSVTPTWEPPGRRYWLEVISRPPVHIIATGRGDQLDFISGPSEVAIIPERELKAGRYVYNDGGDRFDATGRHWTPATRRAIELAVQEAQVLGDDHIGTEHLLLGLLGAADGEAAALLSAAGVSAEGVRAQLQQNDADEGQDAVAGVDPADDGQPESR